MVNIPKVEAYWRYGMQREGDVIWSPWEKNTICIGLGDYLGVLMTQKSTPASGSVPSTYDNNGLYMAIGEGVFAGGWDFPNPIPPAPNTSTLLVAEAARQAVVVVGYRQGVPPSPDIRNYGQVLSGNPPTYPAVGHFDRPIYQANWGPSVVFTHGLREVGLFGGPGCNTANGGLLLNVLRFPVQAKTLADPYTLFWEVEFKINWS